jgi:8-oxo-dGTP pyrophosphatase MutT (NUDIX family)
MADAAEAIDESTQIDHTNVVMIIYYKVKEKEKDKEKFYILSGESSIYLFERTGRSENTKKNHKMIEEYQILKLPRDDIKTGKVIRDETNKQKTAEIFSERAIELEKEIKKFRDPSNPIHFSVKFDKIIKQTDARPNEYFSTTNFIKPRGKRGLIKGGIDKEDQEETPEIVTKYTAKNPELINFIKETTAIVREVKEETGFEITNFHPGSFQVIGEFKHKKSVYTVFSYMATIANRDEIIKSIREMNDRHEGELFDIKFEEVDPACIEKYNYNEASKKSLRIFFQFHKPVQTPMSVSKPMCAPKKKFKSKKSKKPKKPKKRSTTRRHVCSPLCKRV